MQFIADFHIHSEYSRATSKDMNVEMLAHWATVKGINLMGTGDFTHPNYFAQLKVRLTQDENGLYKLKKSNSPIRFIPTAEISNMFAQGGKTNRRIHTIIFAPDFQTVDKINSKLKTIGNIASDGRPIFGRPVKEMVKLVLDISPKCFIVPAHAWTPWFSLFGANSGFDSIEECFEEEAKNIHCIETGLSSDPAMNWRLSKLDNITLISNSDAHSPRKIGREANIFNCKMSYDEIIEVLRTKDYKRFLSTVEFFPEEGKYHFDGHRDCNIMLSPEQSKKHKNICPKCKRTLTIGVMNRVDALADRPLGFTTKNAIPYKSMVPLEEIIADVLQQKTGTNAVDNLYKKIVSEGKNEFHVLLDMPLDEISRIAPNGVVEGIRLVRNGKLEIIPGHDGVYGKISIPIDRNKFTDKVEKISAIKEPHPNSNNQISPSPQPPPSQQMVLF
ncbi:MAG: endonuclease Q family protein [Candidatus Brocadiia bacterium]